jgi:hypothetical protein
MNLDQAKGHGYRFLSMRESVKAALRLAVKAQLRNHPPRELRLFEDSYFIGFEKADKTGYQAITLPVIDTDNESEIEKAIAWLKEQIDSLD